MNGLGNLNLCKRSMVKNLSHKSKPYEPASPSQLTPPIKEWYSTEPKENNSPKNKVQHSMMQIKLELPRIHFLLCTDAGSIPNGRNNLSLATLASSA